MFVSLTNLQSRVLIATQVGLCTTGALSKIPTHSHSMPQVECEPTAKWQRASVGFLLEVGLYGKPKEQPSVAGFSCLTHTKRTNTVNSKGQRVDFLEDRVAPKWVNWSLAMLKAELANFLAELFGFHVSYLSCVP